MEQSLIGWKEFELEVMRDLNDNCMIVCSIENVDPMGVHTGDSITVAPAQTLTDKEYQRLRDASIAIIREMGVECGGSNVQMAVNPEDGGCLTAAAAGGGGGGGEGRAAGRAAAVGGVNGSKCMHAAAVSQAAAHTPWAGMPKVVLPPSTPPPPPCLPPHIPTHTYSHALLPPPPAATGEMQIIEMNPRVSRSSALASKATGFPIAKMAAKLAVGYTLDQIANDITKKTPASFEPSIDYIVTKIPKFAFEKFPGTKAELTTQVCGWVGGWVWVDVCVGRGGGGGSDWRACRITWLVEVHGALPQHTGLNPSPYPKFPQP